jgi:hypothetical protein
MKSLSGNMVKMHTNYTYEITKIEKDHICVKDVFQEDVKLRLTNRCVMSCFTLGHCNTVHSTQGDTIEEKFVICDFFCHHEGITKEWLYTAVTRTSDLDNVYFLAQSLYMENVMRVFKTMVRRYRDQDKDKNRKICDKFVTVESLYEMWKKNKKCRCCGETMSFTTGHVNKITANRLRNSEAHHMDNVELLCYNCNRSLSDRV